MKQEEKDKVLSCILSMMPYGLMVLGDKDKEFDGGLCAEVRGVQYLKEEPYIYLGNSVTPFMVEECRPYLRSMESMTEEENEEYQYITERWMYDTSYSIGDSIDWLNKRMFDYLGLIPMGLASEAPGGMYI